MSGLGNKGLGFREPEVLTPSHSTPIGLQVLSPWSLNIHGTPFLGFQARKTRRNAHEVTSERYD